MKRRRVLATVASVFVAGCSAPNAGCPSFDFEGEEVCPSHELAIELQAEPSRVRLPAELEFTITNETEYQFVFSPELYPIVYERDSVEWTQVSIERRFVTGEPVSVSNSYTFAQEFPFYEWDPEPGRYVLLFSGRFETTDGERTRPINLVDTITVRSS